MPVFKFWHGKTLKININKLIWKIFKKKKKILIYCIMIWEKNICGHAHVWAEEN